MQRPHLSEAVLLVHHLLCGSKVQNREPAYPLDFFSNIKELGTHSFPSLLPSNLEASLSASCSGPLVPPYASVRNCLRGHSTASRLQAGVGSHPTCVPSSQTQGFHLTTCLCFFLLPQFIQTIGWFSSSPSPPHGKSFFPLLPFPGSFPFLFSFPFANQK